MVNMANEEFIERCKKVDALSKYFIDGECSIEHSIYFLNQWCKNKEFKDYHPESTNLLLLDNILFLIPKENGKAIRLIKAN
jgi:hypothetical protein